MLKYDEILLWGRSFGEYRRMFRLTHDDLNQKIMACSDGAASFNAEMFQQGKRVVSCDPIYRFGIGELEARMDRAFGNVMEQTRRNLSKFVWSSIESLDQLGRLRLEAMGRFLADYNFGRRDGRYIPAALPNLPFGSQSFDLALCSHFLFLYSDNLSLEFHKSSIDELCRVAREVRIFPLLTYNGDRSLYVDLLLEHWRKSPYAVSIERVPYEFQRGGNTMIRLLSGAKTWFF